MHTQKSVVICLVCFVFLSCASLGAAQQLRSARVLSAHGAVEIRRQTGGRAGVAMQPINLAVNDEVRAGDLIVTQRGGRLVLGLSDGSQAVIGEHTTIEVGDFRQSPGAIFHILRGRTRVRIERSGGRPRPYRVNTPTAVIAVRGTIFDVLVKENETRVFVHEGEVAVSNTLLPDQSLHLIVGQQTRILRGRLPETPKPFKPGQNDRIFAPPVDERQGGNTASGGRGADGFPGNSGNTPARDRGNLPGSGMPGVGGSPGNVGNTPAAGRIPTNPGQAGRRGKP